jgi:hypothetical protein
MDGHDSLSAALQHATCANKVLLATIDELTRSKLESERYAYEVAEENLLNIFTTSPELIAAARKSAREATKTCPAAGAAAGLNGWKTDHSEAEINQSTCKSCTSSTDRVLTAVSAFIGQYKYPRPVAMFYLSVASDLAAKHAAEEELRSELLILMRRVHRCCYEGRAQRAELDRVAVQQKKHHAAAVTAEEQLRQSQFSNQSLTTRIKKLEDQLQQGHTAAESSEKELIARNRQLEAQLNKLALTSNADQPAQQLVDQLRKENAVRRRNVAEQHRKHNAAISVLTERLRAAERTLQEADARNRTLDAQLKTATARFQWSTTALSNLQKSHARVAEVEVQTQKIQEAALRQAASDSLSDKQEINDLKAQVLRLQELNSGLLARLDDDGGGYYGEHGCDYPPLRPPTAVWAESGGLSSLRSAALTGTAQSSETVAPQPASTTATSSLRTAPTPQPAEPLGLTPARTMPQPLPPRRTPPSSGPPGQRPPAPTGPQPCLLLLRSRNPGIQVVLVRDFLLFKGTQRPLDRTDNPAELMMDIDLHGITRKPAVNVLHSSLLYYYYLLETKALDERGSRHECVVAEESSSSRRNRTVQDLGTTIKCITIVYVVGQGIHSAGAVPILRNTFMRVLAECWGMFEHGIDASNEGQIFVKVRRLK